MRKQDRYLDKIKPEKIKIRRGDKVARLSSSVVLAGWAVVRAAFERRRDRWQRARRRCWRSIEAPPGCDLRLSIKFSSCSIEHLYVKTSQALWMLSSVAPNCEVTKIVIKGSQLPMSQVSTLQDCFYNCQNGKIISHTKKIIVKVVKNCSKHFIIG